MPTSSTQNPLIVGAGPVGKAAALFLARAGISTRIIDSCEEPSPHSKALAVSPRTLELLEPTGVTEKMLSLGLPASGARFWRGDKPLADVDLKGLKHKYPFMLALSQATTERLLGEALEEQGGKVERGTSLTSCHNTTGGVEAQLQHATSGNNEIITAPWLFAADGAHSVARHELDLKFSGTSFESPWYLVDVPLKSTLDENRAHIVLLSGGGFLFLMRVIDDAGNTAHDAPLWRVLGSMPDPLNRLVHAEPVAPPIWTSSFHIVHRIVDRFQVGNIYLAGDAAHLHSPVGARGMNLGIEDAFVFSVLAKTGQLANYSSMRHPVDYMVVKRVEMISRMARGQSAAARLLRVPLIKWLTRIPAVRHQLMRTVSGLDHELKFDRPAEKPALRGDAISVAPEACSHNPFLGAGS